MSRTEQDTSALLQALERASRDYAGRSVMFHQAIADSLGLNVTDLKCLDLARDMPEITPSKLAALTGLTTGSITAVLDRLEQAGYICRERDLHDRRKVIIQPIPEWILPRLTPIFTSLGEAMAAEFGTQYSQRDLALILDFIQRSGRVLQHETAKLRAQTAPQAGVKRLE
jgi:DNA-binding MarR family transcriptional regulator